MNVEFDDFGVEILMLAFGAFTATACALYLYFCTSGQIVYELQLVVLLFVLMSLSIFLAVDSIIRMISGR